MRSKNDLRIVAMLSQKGGSGKTTLAVHLAVAAQQDGKRVVIIDTDPQMSALYWYGARKHKNSEMPVVVRGFVHDLSAILDAARADGMTLAIIDTPPHATPEAFQAVSQADFIIMPCRPTALDLRAMTAAVAIARASKRTHAIVLNGCPLRAPETREARTAMEAEFGASKPDVVSGGIVPGIAICETSISDRRGYFRAFASGRGISEFEPHGRGAEEIQSLWQWTKERIS